MYVASMVLVSSSTLRDNICATANIVADEVSIAELSFSKETKGNYNRHKVKNVKYIVHHNLFLRILIFAIVSLSVLRKSCRCGGDFEVLNLFSPLKNLIMHIFR
jgi:hypothetical protein